MKNNNPLLPELRFPEFINDGEWELIKLGDYSNIAIGGTPSTTVEEYWNGDINWIGSGEIKNDVIKAPTKYITKLGLKKSSTVLLSKGTTVLAMTGATLGKIGYLEIDSCGNQSVAGFINLKKLNSKFLFYKLLNETKQILSFAGGGAQAGINKSNIENIIICRPKDKKDDNIFEQQKIADCLSSLDTLLMAHTEKLKLLQNHKKGLLQNLFPQGDSKTPEYRFKEFEKDGEWEDKKLGEIVSIITEKVGNRKFTLISIDSGVGLISQIEKFGREIAGNSYSNYIVVKKDDFAFNKSSTKVFPEGQISILDKYEAGAVPNSIFTCFRVKQEEVIPYYLKFLFDNNLHGKWLRKYIAIGARANGALNVNNSDLLELKIPLPKILEQQKIADTLSSLDDLINAQTQKIIQLQQHKKGLLQGLFPKINM